VAAPIQGPATGMMPEEAEAKRKKRAVGLCLRAGKAERIASGPKIRSQARGTVLFQKSRNFRDLAQANQPVRVCECNKHDAHFRLIRMECNWLLLHHRRTDLESFPARFEQRSGCPTLPG